MQFVDEVALSAVIVLQHNLPIGDRDIPDDHIRKSSKWDLIVRRDVLVYAHIELSKWLARAEGWGIRGPVAHVCFNRWDVTEEKAWHLEGEGLFFFYFFPQYITEICWIEEKTLP